MSRKVWILGLLLSCVSVPKASIRAAEASKLKSCLSSTSLAGRLKCAMESRERCLDQGLEARCATDGLW